MADLGIATAVGITEKKKADKKKRKRKSRRAALGQVQKGEFEADENRRGRSLRRRGSSLLSGRPESVGSTLLG